MILRLLLCLLLVSVGFTSCAHPEKKKTAAEEAKAKEKKKPAEPTMRDVSNDTTFQAFVGHLRAAVAKRDRAEIATLLAPDFGYRWDDPPAGETPFDFWEKENLWPELESLLGGRFVPHESYMVAPAKFVTESNYRGHRVGIRLFGGSWKLAYFISGEDVLQ